MIKTIIKRSGDREEFNSHKINKWGEWAASALGSRVDWSSVVLETVSSLPNVCTSKQLQERLIKVCLDYNSWSYNLMAGRLYAAIINKDVYDANPPLIRELHSRLKKLNLMEELNYTSEEYDQIQKMIDHSLDFKASHFELEQIRKKYSLQNRVTKKEYETQQFVYMRMAMAIAQHRPQESKLKDVEALYRLFSKKKLNAPTPNFVNLGTPLNGYASCCLYTSGDSARSLAIGDHIAYTMTYMSAGIGGLINTRSLGDPVRGGVIEHQGKLNYFRSLVGAVKANLQNGRGGAATTYYSVYDPEVMTIVRLKNQLSTEDKKIRGIDYAATFNKFFARKAARNEEIFTFNCYTAPDLHAAFYSGDEERFAELYEKYESDKKFKKNYLNARDILIAVLTEAYETGRHYLMNVTEVNTHTPFKDTIYSSNLCLEIAEPTKPYLHMKDLYSTEDHGNGEIALCSLAAINVANIKDDEEYQEACYYALMMIDRCIQDSHYEFPHLELTAKSRMNAGVGMMGLAHHMARKGLSYTTIEGKNEIHRISELHMYSLIKASLRLSKEYGVAPWIHKTKWVDGWLPIDTYNKNVDSVHTQELKYDWEALREEIVENGGIRNSVLYANMPGESSSKSSGTTNGAYPIRDLSLTKGDNSNMTYWCAPEGERLAKKYDIVWDVPTKDLIDTYAILQKFCDQTTSADLFRKFEGDETISSKEMLEVFFYMTKMGMKTRYYQNSKTKGAVREDTEEGHDAAPVESEGECESCTI